MPAGSWCYLESPDAAAISAWLDSWWNAGEGGALALVAESSAPQVSILQAACARAGIPLLGAVFPALVVEDRFQSAGFLLLRARSPLDHVLLEGASASAESIAGTVEALAGFVDGWHADAGRDALLLVFDAMVPNVSSILDGLYAELGDQVRYIGANAGSERFRPMPCLFDADRIIGDGVLAVRLPDHPGAVLEHGYVMRGELLVASGVQGNRIAQIGWQPAFEKYRDMARALYDVEINRDNFYQVAVHFPFGLVRADGQVLVRIPVGLADDGSIACVGEIPENALLTVLSAVPPGSPETVDAVAREMAAFGASGSLLFYCAGRRMHLGEAALDELSRLYTRLDAPLCGALSLGEIGNSRQGGYALFHNATLVGLPWI